MAKQSITPIFHHNIAKSIYEEIRSKRSHYFHFLSNVNPWDDLDNVPTYSHSPQEDVVIRSNMISVKEIEIGNVAYMIPDVKWASGTIYAMYDDLVDMYGLSFYTIVDGNIYKCIRNGGGVPSINPPSGEVTEILETADGYAWKFMGNIPPAFSNKFAGSGYVPIATSAYNQYYGDGSILQSNIIIQNPGSGYDSQANAEITGDGTGAEVEMVLDSNGAISDLILTNSGLGYTYANLTITKGLTDPGSGADIEVVVGNYGNLDTNQAAVEAAAVDGSLSSIILESGGTGYNIPSNVSAVIEGDGSGANIELEIVDGVITEAFIVENGYGSGYKHINIQIEDSSITPGSGGSIRGILAPRGGHGKDLPRELYSQVLCFFTTLEDDYNQGIQVLNEYNQVGLIKDFSKFENTSIHTDLLASTLYNVATANIQGSGVNINSLVYSNQNKYRVISYNDDISNILLQVVDHDIAPTNTSFYGDIGETLKVFDVTSIANEPTVDKYSGDLMFAENRQTFSVSGEFGDSDQGVKFRTFISF